MKLFTILYPSESISALITFMKIIKVRIEVVSQKKVSYWIVKYW